MPQDVLEPPDGVLGQSRVVGQLVDEQVYDRLQTLNRQPGNGIFDGYVVLH